MEGGKKEGGQSVEKKSSGSQTIEGQRITQSHSCRFLGPSPENQTLYVWGRDMQSKENTTPSLHYLLMHNRLLKNSTS